MDFYWNNRSEQAPKSYKCGYCNESISSNVGYAGYHDLGMESGHYIYICHVCDRPTFFEGNKQTPGSSFGDNVGGIDNELVESLYQEARDVLSKNAYTASILLCRKLLMHIAVSKGASEKMKFIEYVKYLSEKGYVPPDSKSWVDHIRYKGNEANHEIAKISREDAEDLLSFISVLLKIIYEFPSKMKAKQIDTQKK